MLSVKILADVINYCDCCTDGETDANIPCTNAHDCIYKAECDEIRYTYNKKPFALADNIREE